MRTLLVAVAVVAAIPVTGVALALAILWFVIPNEGWLTKVAGNLIFGGLGVWCALVTFDMVRGKP